MDLVDLKHEVVQCLVRSQRIADKRDAEWLRQLAAKLAAIADAHDAKVDLGARRVWLRGGGFEPPA